jgi:pilus assembly protein FimV
LAAAVGMTAIGTAQAVSLGHARVVSAPGAPLQVLVPLTDLTPDEAANLRISLADAAAWQQAGLQPPTPLADMHAALETGAQGSREVLVTSSQPPSNDAIDVLLDMQSNAGQRQLQVTVLVPANDISSGIQKAGVSGGAPSASGAHAAGGASAGQVKVARGQTLWGIASSHAVANATIYQELVALWRANPQAFIQNNMNLVRSGATLKLPDAATVQAIDPAEARRIFDEQAAAFQRYRGHPGASASAQSALPVANKQAGASSGKVEPSKPANNASAPSTQDQLRLSTPSQTDAKADAKADADTSNQHAMEDASKRIDELQANVQALGQATTGNAQQGAAGNGQNGQGGQNAQSGAASPSGAANASSPNASNANASSPSSTESSNNAAASGASSASGAAAASNNGPITGPSSPTATALDEAKDTAKQAVHKSGMADWLSDNLLIVVTAVLVVIIFIVALLMRRAGQHGDDDDDDSYGYADPSMGDETGDKDIDHRISGINLDLDRSHDDTHPPGGRT